jgi:HlyD family secretion protein
MHSPSQLRLHASIALAGLALLLPSRARSDTLTALGRVLPASGIVDVPGTPGDTVLEIKVKEGDWVEPGQSLAILSSGKEAQRRLAQSEKDLAAARASAAQDVEIGQARVAAAETEATITKERYDRMYSARNSEFISPDQLADRTVAMGTANVKLLDARQALDRARRDGEKSVQAAEDGVRAARAALALAEVQSPIHGRVLKTLVRPGSTAGTAGLFKVGDTSAMVVVAEVYQDDILRVKPGQRATISAVALPEKMTGVVASVSSLIFRNSLESFDPNQSSQTRIVEVTIKMDKVAPLDRLVLLQVDVSLAL